MTRIAELEAENEALYAQVKALSRPVIARLPADMVDAGALTVEVLFRPDESRVDVRVDEATWTPLGLLGGEVEVRVR